MRDPMTIVSGFNKKRRTVCTRLRKSFARQTRPRKVVTLILTLTPHSHKGPIIAKMNALNEFEPDVTAPKIAKTNVWHLGLPYHCQC